MSKPVVFVIGATGSVGLATVKALVSKYTSQVEIRAGVRNPEKADQLKSLGVPVVKAEMGSAELENTLRGVDVLFINTPGIEHRAEPTVATAVSAKNAGVKHQVIVSLFTPERWGSILGGEFAKLEKDIEALGIAFTFLRLPSFVENYFGFKDTIKSQSVIANPLDASKRYNAIVVADAGNAAAAVLVNPSIHSNKTYDIVSDRHSYEDVVAAFSEALGKTITYNRVSYDDARKFLSEAGFPEWRTDGVFQYYKHIDVEEDATSGNDYQTITGEQPTNLATWVSQVKGAFE